MLFFFVGCEKPFRKLFLPFRVEFTWLVPAAAASSIADPFYRWEIIIISNHSLFRFNVFSFFLCYVSRLTSHRISFRQSHANTRTEQRNSCVDVELIEHERLQWLLWVWCVRLFWISFNASVESKRIYCKYIKQVKFIFITRIIFKFIHASAVGEMCAAAEIGDGVGAAV